MAVIEPAAFNERFTIYMNTEGEPVQRTLREMTPREVELAVRWAGDEANRLVKAAEAAEAGAEPLVAKGFEATEDEIAAIRAAGEVLLQAAEAGAKLLRLRKLVRVRARH